jgi:membrane protein implicated in regulation of membrane protease activity
MNQAAVIWFVLMVVFLVAEASCPIHLISIWFAAGSLVATIVSLLGGPIWLQITLFLVVSAALLAALWPFVKKFIKPRVVKTNVDAIVGKQGPVTAPIDNVAATGQIKLGAMEWSARSTSGEPIAVGTLVKVDRIEGVKVFVSPVEVRVNL